MQNPWKVKMAMARKKFLFHLGWMIDFKIAVENIPKHPWPRWTANSTRLLHELWTQSSHQKLALECSQHQSTIRFFGRGFDQFLRFGTTPEQETQVQGDIQYWQFAKTKIDGLPQSQNQSKMALACDGSLSLRIMYCSLKVSLSRWRPLEWRWPVARVSVCQGEMERHVIGCYWMIDKHLHQLGWLRDWNQCQFDIQHINWLTDVNWTFIKSIRAMQPDRHRIIMPPIGSPRFGSWRSARGEHSWKGSICRQRKSFWVAALTKMLKQVERWEVSIGFTSDVIFFVWL